MFFPKRFAGFICFLFLGTFLFSQENFPEMRGIWLSRSAVSSGRTAMRAELENIKRAGYNAVFVNNWYKGGMIYESDVLESYGGIRQLSEYTGRDPMQEIIEEAHRLGLEVHAWFEYGLWNWLSYDSTNVGPVLENRRDWLMQDRNGRNFSVMSGSIYQFWMDPAHPEVVTFMTEIYAECARLYPELNGIQTDRIRYPGKDFSFSAVSRTAYMDETGGSDPLTISESDAEWDDFIAWRERKTSDVAKAVYEAVKDENPACLVSAAVVPPYMLSGSSDKLQDWPTWVREGSVDLLCPMLYGLHPDISTWLNRCLDEFDSPLRFAPGFDIATVMLSTLSSTVTAIRKEGMAGAVTWYYGDLTDDKRDYFRDNIYTWTTPSFHVSPTVDDVDSHYTCPANMSLTPGGHKNYYHTGGLGSSFKWDIPLYVSGEYTLQTFIPEEWTGADTLYYRVEHNEQAEAVSVTRPETGGWLTLLKKNFQYDDSVRVILTGSNTGLIAADAVRMMKKVPLNILEGFTPDERSLRLLFNNTLNSETGNDISCFNIDPPVPINSVTIDPFNPAILILSTAGFDSGTDYELQAFGLTEADGTVSDTLFFEFQYFSGLDTVIDNSDSYFSIQTGNWTVESEVEGYTGTDYLTTPAGDGTARVFWRYAPPVSGLYRISALFPAGPEFVTDAMYILKDGSAYDTLSVDQSIPGENSEVLGTQWLDAGTFAVVKLHNESPLSPGKKVAADAVRISRVFPSSLKGESVQPELPVAFEMTPNYPNPFNSRTRFTYRLNTAGEIIIRIFSIRGRMIREISRWHTPGIYNLEVDLTREASGIYFYQASALGVNIKGKMLYIK